MPQNKKNQPSLLGSRALLVTMRWVLVAAWTGVTLVAPWDFGTIATILRFGAYVTLSFLFANAQWQHIPLKNACAVAFFYAVLIGTINALFLHPETSTISNLIALATATCGAAIGSVIAYPLLQRIDNLISLRGQ